MKRTEYKIYRNEEYRGSFFDFAEAVEMCDELLCNYIKFDDQVLFCKEIDLKIKELTEKAHEQFTEETIKKANDKISEKVGEENKWFDYK